MFQSDEEVIEAMGPRETIGRESLCCVLSTRWVEVLRSTC